MVERDKQITIRRSGVKYIDSFFFFPVLFLFLHAAVQAQIEIEEEPKRLYFERTRRITKFSEMKDMRDALHLDKFLMGKNRISGNISFNTGRVIINDGITAYPEMRKSLAFFTRIRFFEQFSINTTFYKDFNPRADARWISDYTYTIGRYNWKPNKFNYGYENYGNNQYSDNFRVFMDRFLTGYFFVSYAHYASDSLIRNIRIDNSTNFRLTYFARYAIKYRDAHEQSHGGIFSGKPSVGAGFRYTILRGIYFESAAYVYIGRERKQPWDPDFTYGFGYFDWRSFRLSVTYGNWAINRFPWNEKHYPGYSFLDGNFRLIANWIW